MNSFQFEAGGAELLSHCNRLGELFIKNQTQNTGAMSFGVEEYIQSLQNGGLGAKTKDGKLYVQLVHVDDGKEAIGFCVTSLTKERVGEVEAIYVVDRYRGYKLGSKLFQNALAWMEQQKAIEQKLVVAAGNENVALVI